MEKRHQDHLHGDEPHRLVGHHHRQIPRLARRAMVERGHARGALDDRIVRGLLRIAAVLAETEHPAVDDARIDCPHFVIGELQARHRRRPHIPHEHVRAPDETQERLIAGRLLQIQHERALVAVQVQELRTHAGGDAQAADRASQVTRRTFHLDDLGAVIRQCLGRERTHDDRCEVDDAYAFEGTAGHARYVAPRIRWRAPLRRSRRALRRRRRPRVSLSSRRPTVRRRP